MKKASSSSRSSKSSETTTKQKSNTRNELSTTTSSGSLPNDLRSSSPAVRFINSDNEIFRELKIIDLEAETRARPYKKLKDHGLPPPPPPFRIRAPSPMVINLDPSISISMKAYVDLLLPLPTRLIDQMVPYFQLNDESKQPCNQINEVIGGLQTKRNQDMEYCMQYIWPQVIKTP